MEAFWDFRKRGMWKRDDFRLRKILFVINATLLISICLSTLLSLPDHVSGQGNPDGIRCRENGAFRAYTEKEREDCHNCDFYICIFYPNLNKWLVRLHNCTGPLGGNSTYVYSFDERSRRCTLNVTATQMKG